MPATDENELFAHQQDLDSAFRWVRFAYRQGRALLDALEGRLIETGVFQALQGGTCYTSSRGSEWRFVWLDTKWYVALNEAPLDQDIAIFTAISYASEARTGSYLLAGAAELETSTTGAGSALLENPSANGHWLLWQRAQDCLRKSLSEGFVNFTTKYKRYEDDVPFGVHYYRDRRRAAIPSFS